MQTEVLRYIHTEGDYEVIVRTQDIGHSWERFKGRINYTRRTNTALNAPEEYCRYTSKDMCHLRLYDPMTLHDTDGGGRVSLPDGNEWERLWPVVFETCKYQIKILFHDVDEAYVPEVCHVRKDIEDCFFYDEESSNKKEKSLTGDIDFINEPGVFRLEFNYQKNGKRKDSYITFDVVSPKLDTKNDYKSLLRDVNEEYQDVIYRYLSITIQQFSRGHVNNDATWMTAFQGIVDDYIKNIKRVIHNPHSQVIKHHTSRKAEHIKQWTAQMEETYEEVRCEGRLEEHYFGYNEKCSTHDTTENRFVKHTVASIGKRLTVIINTVLNATNEELSERHRQTWIGYKDALQKIAKHPFFRGIGKFDGMKQESLVLQNRNGYQQIYKDWLKLRRGIDLYHGAANIGTLQIWEVYELWCFIKMKRMVAEVLGIDRNMPDYERYVTEPKGTLLNPFTNSSLEHIVEYRYPMPKEDDSPERKRLLEAHKGDIVSLHYQHTFNRKSGHDKGYCIEGINTATTEQRPDIVLNIRKESGEVVLTYLYDAKYQVINDARLDKDFEPQDIEELKTLSGGDYPPTKAINQMHRYRDAIYYSKEHEPYRAKEIIGGYILFPGRGEDEHISNRYYSKSVESVNIGAFPLLPNADKKLEGRLLREHLRTILIDKVSTENHVENAKPQRTLAYVTEEEKEAMMPDDLVMIAFAGNEEKRQWTFENSWYNIPLNKIADTPWMKAKYLLLRTKGEQYVGNLRKIVKSNHDVWTKERLQQNNYPGTPSHSCYFMVKIHKAERTEEHLREKIFNIKDITTPYWGHQMAPFMLVKLKDLTVL